MVSFSLVRHRLTEDRGTGKHLVNHCNRLFVHHFCIACYISVVHLTPLFLSRDALWWSIGRLSLVVGDNPMIHKYSPLSTLVVLAGPTCIPLDRKRLLKNKSPHLKIRLRPDRCGDFFCRRPAQESTTTSWLTRTILGNLLLCVKNFFVDLFPSG